MRQRRTGEHRQNPTNMRIESVMRRAISAEGIRLFFDETGAPAGIVCHGHASTLSSGDN
jgi:hypothetical protein